MSPKSIQEEFMKQFRKFCTLIDVENKTPDSHTYKLLKSKIISICYNSGKTFQYFNDIPHKDSCAYIIDEAHLFLNSIMKTNIPDPKTEKEKGIKPKDDVDVDNKGQCMKVFNELRKLKDSYFLFLTGTPAAKTPFETVPMFNLAGTNFPENIEDFMENHANNVPMLKTKLKGLVAHVAADNSLQKLKSTPLNVHEVEMSYYQYSAYIENLKKEFSEHGYITHVNKFGWGFGQISSFHAKTFGDSIYVPPEEPADVQTVDATHAPKILVMFNDAEKVHGKCCFYFKFLVKGVETMAQHLENNGYELASSSFDEVFTEPKKRYIKFTGEETVQQKYNYIRMFNQQSNIYGDYIKYIILSGAGSVGINLGAVRYLGIGSVEFNYSAIRQIIGRCNRLNSHVGLPVKDRTISNNIYISTTNKAYLRANKEEMEKWYKRRAPNWDEEFPSIERCIFQDSIADDAVNEAFREVLREVSIV
jgi:hypothetical protein